MTPELEKECLEIAKKFDFEGVATPNSLSYISDKKLDLKKFRFFLSNKLSWHFSMTKHYPGKFYPCLSEEFIRFFQKELDWCWVASASKLSEEFIEEFIDRLHFHNLCGGQNLSEKFIEKHKDRLDKQCWTNIFMGNNRMKKLSKKFILKNKAKISPYFIKDNCDYLTRIYKWLDQ